MEQHLRRQLMCDLLLNVEKLDEVQPLVRSDPIFVESVLRHRPTLYAHLTYEERCCRSDPSLAVLAAARAMAIGAAHYRNVPSEVRESPTIPHAAFILASIGCCYYPGYKQQVQDYERLPRHLRDVVDYPMPGVLDALRGIRLGVTVRRYNIDDPQDDDDEVYRGTVVWKVRHWAPCPTCNPAYAPDRGTAMVASSSHCTSCTAYEHMHLGLRYAITESPEPWTPPLALAQVFLYPPMLRLSTGDWWTEEEHFDEDVEMMCANLYSRVPRAVIAAIDARTSYELTRGVFCRMDSDLVATAYAHIPAGSELLDHLEFHVDVAKHACGDGIAVMPLRFQREPAVVEAAFRRVFSLANLIRLVSAFEDGAWPPVAEGGGPYNWTAGADMDYFLSDTHVGTFLTSLGWWESSRGRDLFLDDLIKFLRRIRASEPELFARMNRDTRRLVLAGVQHLMKHRNGTPADLYEFM